MNADPDLGQPYESGSGSATLPAVPCPGMVEPVEPLELVVPELELSLPHELWLLGLLNKLGPVFQHPEVELTLVIFFLFMGGRWVGKLVGDGWLSWWEMGG
jgi:hypothetical protein